MTKPGFKDWCFRGDQMLAPVTYDLPSFADDAAAWAGGLVAGQFYRCGSQVCIVSMVPCDAPPLTIGSPAIEATACAILAVTCTALPLTVGGPVIGQPALA